MMLHYTFAYNIQLLNFSCGTHPVLNEYSNSWSAYYTFYYSLDFNLTHRQSGIA